MSGRGERKPAGGASQTKGRVLFPLIAAIGIGALLLSLIAAIAPAVVGDQAGDAGGQIVPPIGVTPGGEEAELRARIAENPNDVEALIILADLLANTGRGTEAITYFERATALRPDDPALRVAFGHALWRLGFSLDAEVQLQRARELAPDDPEPLFLLGQVYEDSNPPRVEDARAVYEALIEQAPESVFAERARERLEALARGS